MPRGKGTYGSKVGRPRKRKNGRKKRKKTRSKRKKKY